MGKRKVVYIVLVFIFLFIVFILTYFTMTIKTKHNIKLPSNSNSQNIDYLQKKGYNLTLLDKIFINLKGNTKKGWIYIDKTKLPRYKFLIALTKKSNHYTPITIIPGETTYYILQMLSEKLNMNLNSLKLAYSKKAIYKEGNFLADTYNIPSYFNENRTISFLIDKSFKEYKKISSKYFTKYDLNKWKKIIIIASILEKEAANKKEMPIIASVIFNRINKNMPLQMDGTLNYGIYSHSKITPQRIKTDKSYYNTYKHKGLPKEPICNVSKDAIISAIKPKKSKYLYFMKNSKGTHNFSVKYKNHIKNIKIRKKELLNR